MSIGRFSSFFVLGALTLSACVVSTNDGDDGETGGSGGRSGSGGSTSTGGSAGQAGSSGGSGQSGAAGADNDASAGAAGQGGGNAGAAGADGSASGGAAGQAGGGAAGASGGTAGQGGSAGADSGACDDSVGTHPDCSGIDPSCVLTTAETLCEEAPNHFKPRVAQNVSQCLIDLSPTEQCNPGDIFNCVDDALSNACDDPSAGVSCTAIIAACPIVGAAQCRLYLSGMTASARASITACMGALINGCNLPACIQAL
jgi:hypothetical protein